MIAGVMRLGDRPVRAVMVPRADVLMVDAKDAPSAIAKRITESGHSRFVVYDGTPETILGVVQAKDLAVALLGKRKPNLRQLVKQAPVIHDTVDALEVVSRLRDSAVHFGLVYDEYGQFEGIVTTADILEAIVGEFREERRTTEPEFTERADGSLLVSGWASVDKVMQRIGAIAPARRDYETLAGFVLERLGQMPKPGDRVDFAGNSFEVVDLDGRRIDKVLVQKLPPVTRRAGR